MLNKDVAQLYTQRARDQVLADTRTAEREYKDCHEDAVHVDLRMQDIHYRVRKSTEKAFDTLSEAPLDTCPEEITPETETIEEHSAEICQNELPPAPEDLVDECILEYEPLPGTVMEKCKNELLAPPWNAQRITECLDEEFTRRHSSKVPIKNYGPHPPRM
jgi:asparagine synthetase B (glutamine-hydrolysing)